MLCLVMVSVVLDGGVYGGVYGGVLGFDGVFVGVLVFLTPSSLPNRNSSKQAGHSSIASALRATRGGNVRTCGDDWTCGDVWTWGGV